MGKDFSTQLSEIVQWQLSQGMDGECPEWYRNIRDEKIVAEYLRCSILELKELPRIEYEHYQLAAHAEIAIQAQYQREQKRRQERLDRMEASQRGNSIVDWFNEKRGTLFQFKSRLVDG